MNDPDLITDMAAWFHSAADAVYIGYRDNEGIMRCAHCHRPDLNGDSENHEPDCLSVTYGDLVDRMNANEMNENARMNVPGLTQVTPPEGDA